MLKANPYTAVVNTGAATNPKDISIDSTQAYWCTYQSTGQLWKIATSSLSGGAITPTNVTDGTSENSGRLSGITKIDTSTVIFSVDATHGHMIRYSDLAGTVDYFKPGKISLTADDQTSDDCTFFYGVSIEDLWGQEHHLMSGMAVGGKETGTSIKVTLWVNILSEAYEEQAASVAAGITALNSQWNDFRRIKKFKIWRAYNSDLYADEPNTNYKFLREIDFDDEHWTVNSANELYSFVFYDTTDEAEISTVAFGSTTGLPELFKPYHVNWKYGTEFLDSYYYGNIRTKELFISKIVRSPMNSPDILYETDLNFANFGYNDGDEIKGFGKISTRIVVFKTERSALFYGLEEERTYPVGLASSDSIVNFNDRVYFIEKGGGIFYITAYGHNHISLPIASFIEDTAVITQAHRELASGVHWKNKEKIGWLYPDGANNPCWLYNYKEGTWDQYRIGYNPDGGTAINQQLWKNGLDGKILSCATGENTIFKHDTGYTDGGQSLNIYFKTAVKGFGEDVLNAIVHRFVMTYKNTTDAAMQLVTYYHDETDTADANVATTLSTNYTLRPKEYYLNEIYASSLWAQFAEAITVATEIENIVFEYYLVD
jgi:hypothetical protein